MLVIFHGEVIDEELEAHISEILKEKYATPEKTGLSVVCNNTSTSSLSYKAIFSAGKRMHRAKFRQNGRLAIVARSPVGFGLAKVYKVATEVDGLDETRVLRGPDLQRAIEWIGISELSSYITEKIEQLEHTTAAAPPKPSGA